MSKGLATVGKVAGVVAAVAMIGTGIGAALGGTMMLTGIASASSIASIAGAVSAIASMGAGMSAKKPRAQGSTSETMIGANLPTPYVMGRTYSGGAREHEAGYGGTVKKVANPYRSMVDVYSLGPVQQIEAVLADFAPIAFNGNSATGYYSGFMYRSAQLGAQPEPAALAGPWGAIPSWGPAHKLSGKAAILYTLKFDKDGKKFASGVPQLGAVLKGVLVYDPRLDSTYPGGSGPQRFDDESTWAWSENPALHALTYARGRYQNGKKVFGAGFRREGLDVAAYVELANVCDANVWKVGGTIYEPGSKWDNLKRILATAAAEPVFVGARLSVDFSSPKIALDTIEAWDLADGEYVVPAMKTWRDRRNGLIPRYRSEQHKWEYVQSNAVIVGTYLAEDRGEEKVEERQVDLCQEKDQAAQLIAYELVNGREFGPIVLPCKPRMIEYVIGEALLGGQSLTELGLAGVLMKIKGRSVDPGTGIVTLTLESETTAKHAFALGRTGTAPPTPSITSGEELDAVRSTNAETEAQASLLIANSSTSPTRVLTASETGGVATVTVVAHNRVYPDGRVVAIPETVVGGLLTDTPYFPYYDDIARSNMAPAIQVSANAADQVGLGRHALGRIRTPITGSNITYVGGGSYPPGGTIGREVEGVEYLEPTP